MSLVVRCLLCPEVQAADTCDVSCLKGWLPQWGLYVAPTKNATVVTRVQCACGTSVGAVALLFPCLLWMGSLWLGLLCEFMLFSREGVPQGILDRGLAV